MERCRLCNCVKNREFCGNIFYIKKTNPTIPTIVELFTNLKIVEDDPYTKFICFNCFHLLIVFYNYRERILETNQLLQNEIENEQNNVEDFHKKWPRIEQSDDGQFVVYKNNSGGDCKTNLRIVSNSEDEDNQPLSLLIRDNKKLTDDDNNSNEDLQENSSSNFTENESNNEELCSKIESKLDDFDDKTHPHNDDDNADKNNQQLKKSSLCSKESLGFIKYEIDIEETCLKTENGINDDEKQKNYENNHHARIPVGDDDEDKLIINDNQFNDNKDFDRCCSVFIKDESSIKKCPSINGSNSENKDNQYLSTLIDDNTDTTIIDNTSGNLHENNSFNVIGNKSGSSEKLIPSKSAIRYEQEYKAFCQWKKERGVKQIEENIMLEYFLDASKKGSSSSLWAKYSMLKSMLLVQENVNIAKFVKVTAFIKKCNVGYQPVQSKILTREEVNRFLKEAPDEQYLLAKVVAMIGITGGCRREELYSMTLDDIQDTGSQLIITIPQTKTDVRRIVSVINEAEGIKFLEIFRKYIALRPKSLQERMLFVGYRQGKCILQRAGIHTIGGIPRKIAEYLNLEHPERYTGQCFRRTFATLLSNAGTDLSVLKRPRAEAPTWNNSSTAEKYVEDSVEGKVKVARII